MKQDYTCEIPESLRTADELLTQYGFWARDRYRRHRCGSAEGKYRSFQDDEDRSPPPLLLHIDMAMKCQRTLARVPERERTVLAILYVPQRLPIEAQLRIKLIPPRLCRERQLLGLRMFENIFRTYC
jgi:hypothetical protein